MRLAEISYELDEYEVDGKLLYGRLDIEICPTDELPVIWAMEINQVSPETGESKPFHFETGKWNHYNAVLMRNKLHADKRLMDDVYDACLVESSYQRDFAS